MELKAYIASLFATDEKRRPHIRPAILQAHTEAEATGVAYKLCQEAYPVNDGFGYHLINVESVSKVLIEAGGSNRWRGWTYLEDGPDLHEE